MTRRLASVLLLLLAVHLVLGAEGAAARPASSAKAYRADRFDVRATLLADRALQVDETIVFRFEDEGFTSAWREIPARRTDGITSVSARMDGVLLPPGRGPGQVEIAGGSRVRVTWHFAPSTGVHVFELTYRLTGVATPLREGVDELAWIALPSEHRYPIDAATIELRLPAGASLIGSPGVSPSDVRVATDGPDRLTVHAEHLAKDRTVRLDARLAGGALSPTPPRWVALEDARGQRGPWLLAIAGAVLVAGLGWLAVFLSAWPRPAVNDSSSSRTTAPDPERPAAVVARLAGRSERLPQVVATMVELAARGVVRIEERGRPSRLRGRRFTVLLERDIPGLAPHEVALLDLAFGNRSPRTREVSWSHLLKTIAHRGAAFGRRLDATMRRAGLLDPERVGARRVLVRAAWLAALTAAASGVVSISLVRLFGGWVAVLPLSAAIVAVAFTIGAARFAVLSRQGELEAARWRAFLAHVKDTVKWPGAPKVPGEWLPWAVITGVAATFVEHAGLDRLPPWFRAAALEDEQTAFSALMASHVHYGGGDGGAGAAGGGGGAAGGGGSGAG